MAVLRHNSRLSFRGLALLSLALLVLACAQNTPPRLVSLVNHDVAIGSTLDFIVTAVDADGDRLFFDLEGKPERARFEATALGGRFLWTPIASDVPAGIVSRTYPVTFVVSDGRGGRDAETVLITVTRGEPGEGAPIFVTPSDFVLDLSESDTLTVGVAVQDEDSGSVALNLDEGPSGAALTTTGPKSAELTWTPTEAQIAERALHLLRVSADDGDHEPVVQEVTVLLKRKMGTDCPGAAPTLAHDALGDQSSPGPFRIEARIFDADSEVRTANLFWSRRPNPTTADFQSVALTADPQEPDLFAANIPDLGLRAGESATITYFLCATDDDDAAGDTCDHAACLPTSDGRFAFVASVGTSTCSDDTFEPNDTSAAAKMVTSGTPLRALRACGGNDDWFRISLAAGDVLEAVAAFNMANGDLTLEAYGPGGTTRIAQAPPNPGGTSKRLTADASTAGTYYVRVAAAASVNNTYDLTVTARPRASCADDSSEPNDTAGAATSVAVGTRTGLRVCPANDDWFKIPLRAGDALDASIAFTHTMGDLDLEVYRPDRTTLLGKSDGVADNESLSFRVVPDTGDYFVRVYGYMNAQNGYSLTLAGASCRNDSLEPNDTQMSAREVMAGTTRSLAICPGDDDWLKIALTQGQRLRVTTRFKHAQGDLDLRVFKPDAGNLASSFSLDDDEQIDVASVPATGTYTIRVFSLGGAQNAYDLEVVVGAP